MVIYLLPRTLFKNFPFKNGSHLSERNQSVQGEACIGEVTDNFSHMSHTDKLTLADKLVSVATHFWQSPTISEYWGIQVPSLGLSMT